MEEYARKIKTIEKPVMRAAVPELIE